MDSLEAHTKTSNRMHVYCKHSLGSGTKCPKSHVQNTCTHDIQVHIDTDNIASNAIGR